jgi:hypothetical protein
MITFRKADELRFGKIYYLTVLLREIYRDQVNTDRKKVVSSRQLTFKEIKETLQIFARAHSKMLELESDFVTEVMKRVKPWLNEFGTATIAEIADQVKAELQPRQTLMIRQTEKSARTSFEFVAM